MFTKVAHTIEHLIAFGALIMFLTLIGANDANAQSVWDQCTDGRAITRCETYDCPNGDTNRDGTCSLDDRGARLSDVRNDSFCANPISGCGEVRYFSANDNNSCAVRVEEKGTSCDLYQTGEPTFTSTPQPTPTPTPTSTPTATPRATSTAASTLTCSALTISPAQPVANTVVDLTIKSAGNRTSIKEYEFEIETEDGDEYASVIQPTATLEQNFTKAGVYTVSAKIITNSGNEITSPACVKDITVVEKGIGGGGTTKGGEELPETGSPLLIGSVFVLLGMAGVYMYDKYRFI